MNKKKLRIFKKIILDEIIINITKNWFVCALKIINFY